jgi:hypothetical protein
VVHNTATDMWDLTDTWCSLCPPVSGVRDANGRIETATGRATWKKDEALKTGMNGDKNKAAEGRTYSCGRWCGGLGSHPTVHRHQDGWECQRARETLEMLRGGSQWGSG